MDAPALAATALAPGRPAADASLALEVFAAAGAGFTESYRSVFRSWSRVVRVSGCDAASPLQGLQMCPIP